MRIYEVARQLNMDSRELIKRLRSINFPVKSHMSVVDKETADIIKNEIEELLEQERAENVLEVEFPLTVKDFAVKLGCKPSVLIKEILANGKLLSINQNVEKPLAESIAKNHGFMLKEKGLIEESILEVKGEENLQPRPPIVTLMGHIDHGKTSILDYIRRSRIAAKESGGITQHIGAYQIEHSKGKITFIDTPGHETFTAMRARGANITDIAVIVVAADDGVKPQTIEAVNHARAANVAIIVAINKIDKPDINIDMVKQQLSKIDLAPEDWGGRTVTVLISAKTGQGISELLEMILIQAELLELKADYQRPALGVVLEAKLSSGRGPVITAVVQHGVLKTADVVVCGEFFGRVRALFNDRAEPVKEAKPSMPVEIIGISGVPEAGEKFFVVPDEKQALKIIQQRKNKPRQEKTAGHMKLEDLYAKIKEEKSTSLKIIIKSDVSGTLEAIEDMLKKIDSQEVKIEVIHKAVGIVNASDVILADASDSIIIGFKVGIEPKAKDMVKTKGIEVKRYEVIYELFNDIKAALEGMLEPEIVKKFQGRALVKKVFKLSKSGIIAGCIVEKGSINRSCQVEVERQGEVIFKGRIHSLKRFKEDVREVKQGFECGIGVGFNGLKEEDIINAYIEESITRRL